MTSADEISSTAAPTPALKSTLVPGPTLDCADPVADQAEIEQFWTEHFSADTHRYPCYFNNPAEPGAIWVLRSNGGNVIGTGGLHTCLMVIDGHSHRAGHAVNLAIDPKYRTAGPAIQLQRAVLDHAGLSGHSLVCGITDRAAAVQKRAGYHHLGPLEQWTKVLRTESRLQKYLKVPALAKCAGFGLDLALWGVSPEARYRRPPGWKVEIRERFDARFDRLWERAAPQFAIVTERSSKFLDWRFRECSDDRFRTLSLCDATGELAGYAVYRNDGFTVELSDLLSGRPEDLEILIVEVLRHVRKLRPAVRTVHAPYFGNGTLPAALRRSGFTRRPEPKQLLVWANEEELPFSTLGDHDRWYLTAADLL